MTSNAVPHVICVSSWFTKEVKFLAFRYVESHILATVSIHSSVEVIKYYGVFFHQCKSAIPTAIVSNANYISIEGKQSMKYCWLNIITLRCSYCDGIPRKMVDCASADPCQVKFYANLHLHVLARYWCKVTQRKNIWYVV